ncbi:MAG TPA: LUD domain-containing protein [Nitrososphaerales archaeon]|nr:LUD domain-containing protein [Nitrososphaerales archaeon]HUK75473.1 LUD domain-containing protein [Nitrososphaerales archaeon]
MTDNRQELMSKLRRALADRDSSEKFWASMTKARSNRTNLLQKERTLDIHAIKESNKALKASAVADRTLVEEFAENVRRNGGKVFLAKTGQDAIRYVEEVSKRVGAKLIVKAKSLTSDEIDFTKEVEKFGVRAVETDLGELIIQVAGETPVHLVMPAAHKSVQEIATLVSKAVGRDIPPEDQAILKAVRAYLRQLFLTADIGVSGANIGIAESGSIIIETNEGNGRLVTSLPKVHMVIIGMEKIVPKWEDATFLVKGHSASATGQNMTVYVSVTTQHVPLAGSTEGREYHVIILDNGRSRMRDDPWFSEALNCIRCGACMNVCPTYGVAGGHTFGYIYPGPIGIPWTAEVHGLDKATFAHLCVSCGLCKEICPVDINIPMMIAKVKEEEVEENGQLVVNDFFMSSERLAKLASATAPVSNWFIRSGVSRSLMQSLVGVDKRRTLPTFSRKRLRPRVAPLGAGTGSAGKVVFFPDVYADYNDPELGVKAVKVLLALGYRVEVPDLSWSGMPYISYGDLSKATAVAKKNLQSLKGFLDEGYSVVSTEPTAVYMIREVYPTLAPGELADKARDSSFPFFGFIQPKLGELSLRPVFASDAPVGFHIPCHERSVSGGKPAVEFLSAAGYNVQVVENGTCCGMAGTFGMKHGDLGYNLSMEVGDHLFRLFKQSGLKLVATESSVCSMQISDGVGLKVVHPLHAVDAGRGSLST